MRLRSFYASEIDFLKNDCVKLLALNSERQLSKEDFMKFVSKLSDTLEILTNKDDDFYFTKR